MVNNEIIKLKFDNSFNGRLFAVQGDTGRVFNLQVFDDFSKPVDVTGMKLRMYVANSKEVSYSEGEIVEAAEGKVKVQVYNSQLKYPGKQKAQFILTDKEGQKIGSKIFDLWVEEGLEAGSTVGNNIYVDFDKINQILDLIKNYDKTLEEAKKVDSSLKLEIKEGTDTRNNLANCKKKALEIKGQLDTSKVDAQNVLKEFTSAKNTLIDENKKASSNLTSLDAKIAEGKQTVTNLEGKTSAAKATDAILKATDTEAKNTESLIRDLMSQLGKTENEVKQIIAAGDLSKYVTDPKLQEVLKTEVVTSVNGQKGDMMVDFLIGDDTRYIKNIPKDYLRDGTRFKSPTNSQLEFKRCTTVGVNHLISQDYCIVNTQVPWHDKTGGLPMQVAYGKGVMAIRNAIDEDTWGEWQKVSTSNDLSEYATKTEIQQMIEKASSLKKEVVASLPATGKDDVIYLVKDTKGKENNNYLEYLWISGRWEIIGDTKVDLSEYLKKEEASKNETSLRNDFVGLTEFVSDEISKKANKSDVKIKLSEMEEDSTHRTVTDSEKQNWNKKFELPHGKENQVLTKTTNGAEFKNISSSRSATFVIANYDSSENSKAGADYVIQENDCAAEIINSYIAKLPSYGGKIQLTEGNFHIKKNLSINFTKHNTTISGYGYATTISDKLTKDERNSVIVNISNGITNCKLIDLNITHESSNSINIRGNKNHIKNVNIINNGSHPSIYFNDNTSGNILENCNIKCDSSYSYWIGSTSESNTLLRCVGESSSENATLFYVEGKNNKILSCNGKTIEAYVFDISGESNQLSDCTGIASGGTFQISGFKNQLSNCQSVTNKYNGISTTNTAKDILITGCIGVSQSGNGINIEGNNVQVSNSLGISNTSDGIITSTKSQRCIIVNCIAKTSNKREKGMMALGNNDIFMGNVIYGQDNIYSSSVRVKQNNITLEV